jgi:hypothetical protein
VNSDTRRRRRRADVQSSHRRRVRPPRRTGEELSDGRCTRGNVAADEVGIVALDIGGLLHRAGNDAVAKAWRETLDLPFARRSMRCYTAEQRACPISSEHADGDCGRRLQRPQAEASKRKWVAWPPKRPEDRVGDPWPGVNERREESSICCPIVAELFRRLFHGTVQAARRFVVERVCQHHRRRHTFEPMGT